MARFTHRDREQFERLGIDEVDVMRQLERLRTGSRPTEIDRPCRVGDGILVLDVDERAKLVERAREAAAEGRVSKFVPASGAATRMFKELLAAEPDAVLRLERDAEKLPFAEQLSATLAAAGHSLAAPWSDTARRAALDAIVGDEGLGYASMPKALLPFHRYGAEVRTPLTEHVVEATYYARDADGRCTLHVTISEEHRAGFDQWIERELPALSERTATAFDIKFTYQQSRTDTVAADPSHEPFRREDGAILFRPGGHGALIHNMNDLDGDIVVVKNIDNVVRERDLPVLVEWRRALIGYVVRLQADVHEWVRKLDADGKSDSLDDAATFLRQSLACADADTQRANGDDAFRAFALDRLRRPLRVCGVVRNDGEPGGGPFWVRDNSGRVSAQIVESSQIDSSQSSQAAHVAAATHFNPVDLVCALCDADGSSFDLTDYVDLDTAFVAEKSEGGRPLRALERPGLWNGAMAGWNTVMIEVPSETFAPVKTVFDLLRPAHQPRHAG